MHQVKTVVTRNFYYGMVPEAFILGTNNLG